MPPKLTQLPRQPRRVTGVERLVCQALDVFVDDDQRARVARQRLEAAAVVGRGRSLGLVALRRVDLLRRAEDVHRVELHVVGVLSQAAQQRHDCWRKKATNSG